MMQFIATSAEYVLNLMVCDDEDLDGTFLAWDTDVGQWLNVNGWMFSFEEIVND